MFLLLLSINGCPLPAEIVVWGERYVVTEGGLLLAPSRRSVEPANEQADGQAQLRLFGALADRDTSALILAVAQAYRWLGAGRLDCSVPSAPPLAV